MGILASSDLWSFEEIEGEMLCEVVLRSRDMRFVGERTWWMAYRETKGYHHFKVLSCERQPSIVGYTVAVPLDNIEYLVVLKK